MADTDTYVAEHNVSHQEAADIIIGHATSYSFSYADLCSDADAIKLSEIIAASTSATHSFSESLRDYYLNYAQKRCSYFLGDIGCLSNLTAIKDGLSAKVDTLLADIGLKLFLAKWPSAEAVHACYNSFANYIYEELNKYVTQNS